jgi:hypothetical protein
MRSSGLALVILASIFVFITRSPGWVAPALSASQSAGDSHLPPSMPEAYGKLPLYFVENRGQMDERVAYYIQGGDKTIYFTAEGLTFALTEPARRRRWTLKLDFVGANPGARPRGLDQTPAVFSYFKGSSGQRQTGLKTYASIVYPDLWPGIDLIYAGTVNRMKYTFVVKPGADPNRIKLAYRGRTR